FRGLDDSRVRSMPLPVPAAQPTRLPLSVPLPLGDYALSPGDVVKLYARVEDNDPDGPKGSESPIVTVKIVSKEEMQRMMLAREGLEVLLSKYAQAARSMEAANEQLDKLRKELEKLDPNSELAKEMREQLKKAAEQIGKDAEQLSRMSAEDLPFDIDHALKKQLDESAQAMEKASDAASKLARGQGISAAAAAKKLADAQKELAGEREQFKEEAADPLDHLAKVYPLIEDQARFAELWQRQRDLADRMDALTGHDGEDDPKLKSRMRDLEAEQHQLRDELRQLIDDIENRANELPADKRLDDLRETAKKFVKAVRGSSAAEEMASAESGLAEFAGSRAHTQARAAADTLEKFISQGQGMGEEAGTCLKFQPKLASGLGDTVQELLDAEGLGSKPGKGQGSGGGYSARRNSLRNVGMYGRIPMRGKESRAAGGKAQRGASGDGTGPDGGPGNAGGANSDGRLHASGQSDAAVPARYKRRVGEYFQRVADELGEDQQK
ncbi:MAG: smc 7, partial [Phycisphaerales bacterium]|nr:smc 7 [Phycisphaerales bacterium]